MGEAATLGVTEDIELDLADAMIELLGQAAVSVVQAFESFGVSPLQELRDALRQAGVITVVRADYLYLIDAHVRFGRAPRQNQSEHNTHPYSLHILAHLNVLFDLRFDSANSCRQC